MIFISGAVLCFVTFAGTLGWTAWYSSRAWSAGASLLSGAHRNRVRLSV